MHENVQNLGPYLTYAILFGAALGIIVSRFLRLRRNILLRRKWALLLRRDKEFKRLLDEWANAASNLERRRRYDELELRAVELITDHLVADAEQRRWLESGLEQPSERGRIRYLSDLIDQDLEHRTAGLQHANP